MGGGWRDGQTQREHLAKVVFNLKYDYIVTLLPGRVGSSQALSGTCHARQPHR